MSTTCPICRMQGGDGQGHWAWHNYCRGELNPVAFLSFLDRLPQTPEVDRIRRSVVALTGMDIEAARAALAVPSPTPGAGEQPT